MQNSEYLRKNNRIASMYVDGNTVIEIEKEEHAGKVRREKTIEEQKLEGLKQRKRALAMRRNRAMVYAAAAAGGVVVAVIMVLLLCSVITYNTLTNEIESLTSELDTLTLQNDSTEYDIDSSVDLNNIIETATEELGMVRSTSSVVVTYSDADSEYVNKVAEIPDN